MKKISLVLAALIFAGGVSGALAQGNNSQAGGLPALAAEVAELRALLENLQGQVGGDPYVGSYAVQLLEFNSFGCGSTNNPAPLFGTPGILQYFQKQGISSVATRTASFTAEADGQSLIIPDYNLHRFELRLSGKFEEDTIVEGDFDALIAADGSLIFDSDSDAEFSGQISADGSMFSILARGLGVEDGCDDSWVVTMTGVRK